MIEQLEVDDFIEIHQKQLTKYGGPTGIRDQNLLESQLPGRNRSVITET